MNKKSRYQAMDVLKVIFLVAAVLLQVVFMYWFSKLFEQYTIIAYLLFQLISVSLILYMTVPSRNTSFMLAWAFVVCSLSLSGFIMYCLWGRPDWNSKRRKKLQKSGAKGFSYLAKRQSDFDALLTFREETARTVTLMDKRGYPLYHGAECIYFSEGSKQSEAMLADLRKAEKFIFMEHFLIGAGSLWDKVKAVLIEKAARGVEIKIIADDIGCGSQLSKNTVRELVRHGIKIVRFNTVNTYFAMLCVNNRNHRQTIVIDGKIAYAGGLDIADERIGAVKKYNLWKNSAIRIEGSVVWGITVSFLSVWEAESGESLVYNLYEVPAGNELPDGFFLPFSDSPSNRRDSLTEALYAEIISLSREYVYITTTHINIDGHMLEVLRRTVRSGVDVRIVTTGIGGFKYVQASTRSFYSDLISAGVRIYEYPGLMQAGVITGDGYQAVVGSGSMDYRSFNLRYENAVWICGAPVVADICSDVRKTLEESREITADEWKKRPAHVKAAQRLIQLTGIRYWLATRF